MVDGPRIVRAYDQEMDTRGPIGSGTDSGPADSGPADTVRPLSAGREHIPALDGCRAVAAMGVLITHVGLLTGYISRTPGIGPYLARMDVGVTIFFALSGYLLYRPFVAARFAGLPAGDLATYARRRALRILPAYWVALTIIAFVLQAPGFVEPHTVVAHYLLLQIYDLNQLVGGPIQQAWSLATEVAFYVFVPMWAWAMARPWWRRWSQLRVELAGLAVLFVGSTAANYALVVIGVSDGRFAQLGTWLPFRIGDFVPGMALAVVSAHVAHHGLRWPEWSRRASFALACWAGSLVVFWYVSTQLDLPMFPTFTPSQAFAVRMLYLVIATLFLVPAVLHRGERGLVPALLSNPVAVWLGLVSYGIYIWHEAWQDIYLRLTDQPALFASFRGMFVFTLGASLISAAASWYIVEKPAMRLAARAPGTPLRPSARDTAASSSTSR